MALVPVRSKQPDPSTGEQFITEVSEEYLQRWPDDYEPLTGEDLARHEVAKWGVDEQHLEQAVAGAIALAEAGEPTDERDDERDDEHDDEHDEEHSDPVQVAVVVTPEVEPAEADSSTPSA